MGIQSTLERWKRLWGQGADLLSARLQILRLDMAGQAVGLFWMVAALVFSAALFFSAVMSVLFGLNQILDDETKIWVFFSLPAVCLLLIAVLFWRALSVWRRNAARVAQTLQDLQQDIDCLRGKSARLPEVRDGE